MRNEARIQRSFAAILRNGVARSPAAFLLQAAQLVQGFVEGALVSGLIAEEKGEKFFVDALGREAVVLEPDGTLLKPVGLGHLADQQVFGGIGGLEIVSEPGKERFEGGSVFARDEELAGSEAVFERITRRSQFGFVFSKPGSRSERGLRRRMFETSLAS